MKLLLVLLLVGSIALLLTFRYFVKRFPLCSLALVWRFIRSVGETKSCKRGMDLWEKRTYNTIKSYHENRA